MSIAAQSSHSSFVDMVDYPALYQDLAARGTILTEAQKKRCEDICGDSLSEHDGGAWIGSSVFAKVHAWIYSIGVFFVKVKDMLSSGTSFDNLNNAASSFGSVITESNEQTKLFQLKFAANDIYPRLKREGGNLAIAADYIIGIDPNQRMQSSILSQVGQSIDLPIDTDISLNQQSAAIARARPLTQQR